jgi:hypothetical protein
MSFCQSKQISTDPKWLYWCIFQFWNNLYNFFLNFLFENFLANSPQIYVSLIKGQHFFNFFRCRLFHKISVNVSLLWDALNCNRLNLAEVAAVAGYICISKSFDIFWQVLFSCPQAFFQKCNQCIEI